MSPEKTTQPHILMCPPDYYGIEYEINPVDEPLAAGGSTSSPINSGRGLLRF